MFGYYFLKLFFCSQKQEKHEEHVCLLFFFEKREKTLNSVNNSHFRVYKRMFFVFSKNILKKSKKKKGMNRILSFLEMTNNKGLTSG